MEGCWYRVQVLTRRWIALDAPKMLGRLRPDIRSVRGDYDHIQLEIPTDDLPMRAAIFHAQIDDYPDELERALTWSSAWDEPWHETAARCPASIVVALAPRRPINYASFLLVYLQLLDAMLFSLDDADRQSAVLHWIPAQQLMTFDRYVALRTQLGPCGPAVNIRVANATGRPGELLADTIGLAELGLPDLQIVFTGRDPAEVILRLRLLVRAMLVGDRLDCSWIEERAYVPPERDALTLQLE
jgi:hypothetical protein